MIAVDRISAYMGHGKLNRRHRPLVLYISILLINFISYKFYSYHKLTTQIYAGLNIVRFTLDQGGWGQLQRFMYIAHR